MSAKIIILMGVSGSGKSTVAGLVAKTLGYHFLDADDFHDKEAKTLMANGTPLTNEHREHWITRMIGYLMADNHTNKKWVLAFSGLRKAHRDKFRLLNMDKCFIFLDGSQEVIQRRMELRAEHFFPDSLLKSQFSTLQSPKMYQKNEQELDVSIVCIEQSLENIVLQVLATIVEKD